MVYQPFILLMLDHPSNRMKNAREYAKVVLGDCFVDFVDAFREKHYRNKFDREAFKFRILAELSNPDYHLHFDSYSKLTE
jgi:hypothetical protein